MDAILMEDDSSDEEQLLSMLQDDEEECYALINSTTHLLTGSMELCEIMSNFLQARKCRVNVSLYVENVIPQYSEREFVQHFRLQRSNAISLINRFQGTDEFQKLSGHGGFEAITAEKHILAFLWFVGHEAGGFRDIADRFNLSLSSLHQVIGRVCDFILSLAPTIIKWPNSAEQTKTADFFKSKYGFPNVIGSIDGSHIRIDKPIKDSESYINRKGYYSIQMQGIVNENLQFLDVFVGYPGSVHDARVFRESPISPSLSNLCEGEHYILGDSAYPCLPQLIVPYRDNGHLTRSQTFFNVRLSKCRVVVENAFGCLKQRFRQLYHFKTRDIVRLVKLIHACCVLHNIAPLQDLEMLAVNESQEVVQESQSTNDSFPMEASSSIDNTGKRKRDEICRILSIQNNPV